MNQKEDSKRWWESPKVVIAILTVVAGAGLVSVFLPLGLSWCDVLPSKDAQFYVTEVGVPLLTFAGFLAVYLGFLSQRQQNELQKEQLKKQQQNFQKDRFESTFFQLLRTHNEIVNDFSCELPGAISRNGRRCIEKLYSDFKGEFERRADEKGWGDSECAEEGKVRWVYEKWFSSRKSELNHYFSHLARLISFVHRSDVDDKEFYIGLITAQMSLPEQKLFFYHTTLKKNESEHRHLKEIYELLGEYTFFKQVGFKSLIHEQHYQLNKGALGVD